MLMQKLISYLSYLSLERILSKLINDSDWETTSSSIKAVIKTEVHDKYVNAFNETRLEECGSKLDKNIVKEFSK